MAEAVFTGEQVEELALDNRSAGFTVAHAPLTGLAEDLLMRHRPRHACDRNRQDEENKQLLAGRLHTPPSLALGSKETCSDPNTMPARSEPSGRYHTAW